MVEFSAHRIESTYHGNQKTESRFVTSMPENTFVPIFMICIESLTKPKPNQT